MAAPDPVFRTISKSSICFLIWRVENMQLVPVPKDQYGSFFNGDSYLVLSISESGGESGGVNITPRETKKPLDIHIHFWLGQSTSQDEAGVAAYKTVELDDFLGGSPIQHREVQGSESKRFLAYFKSGLRLLNGGVASGFHHVTDEFHPRMFSVKGKRTPVLTETPSISWEHVNNGDVFIVDTPHAVFVWVGKYANNMEKIQAAKVAQELKDDRGDRAIVVIEDGEEDQLSSNEKNYLNQFLPLSKKQVKSYKDTVADDETEKRQQNEIKLYRCSDEEGTLKVTEVKGGPLHQQDLISMDSYIIDNGESGIWVWVGKKASQKERVEAMRNAQGFSKKKGYAHATPVTRVIDGAEPVEFKTLFRSWKDKDQTTGMGKANARGHIAKTVQTKFDAETLHSNHQLAAQTQMVDDGSGKKEVWRVENFDLVPVAPKNYGMFYGGDSYVVFYTYEHGGSENYIIYYWLGKDSTADEKGTAALKTVELDDKYGGKPVQVRVVQGKEPPHFMALFGGKIVILQGGHASGFHNLHDHDSVLSASYMLEVRALSHMNVKAVQVEKRAASLNSNDVFVVFNFKDTFIWAGKGSTGDEREMARAVASVHSKDPTLISEGQEKDDFWEAIGGREDYASDRRLQETTKDHQPRLFQCSNASGQFNVEEIHDFDQSDLIEEDVMLLDAWDSIFLWIGKDSNDIERKLSEETALEYLKSDPSHRDLATPIIRVKQGYEPPHFTGFFGVWDRTMWNNNETYEQLKQKLAENNPGISVVVPHTNGYHREEVERFPLSILLEKDPEKLPEGVDPTNKEIYLPDDEFEQIFGMKINEFHSLANWKQQNLKKRNGLF